MTAANAPSTSELASAVRSWGQTAPCDGVLHDADEIRPGMAVVNLGHAIRVPVGRSLLGRSLDGLGRRRGLVATAARTRAGQTSEDAPAANKAIASATRSELRVLTAWPAS